MKKSVFTAAKYRDAVAETGFLKKEKGGRSSYFINLALNAIVVRD